VNNTKTTETKFNHQQQQQQQQQQQEFWIPHENEKHHKV
jgi:hypothetical protein